MSDDIIEESHLIVTRYWDGSEPKFQINVQDRFEWKYIVLSAHQLEKIVEAVRRS